MSTLSLWRSIVAADRDELYERAFGQDAEDAAVVWKLVLTSRTQQVQHLAAQSEPTEAITELLAHYDELIAAYDRHWGAHGEPMIDAPPVALPVGQTMAYNGTVVAVAPPAAAGVNMNPTQIEATVATAGKPVRVDRVDQALVSLAQGRVEYLLEAAGVRCTPEVAPRNVVVNAALVMILRAGGMSGIEVSGELEAVITALASAGDIERTASIDARLNALGQALERLEAGGRRMNARLVEQDRSLWALGMGQAYTLAADLRLVKPGLGDVGEIDLRDQPVLTVFDRLNTQALEEKDRRIAAAGRPIRNR